MQLIFQEFREDHRMAKIFPGDDPAWSGKANAG